MEYLLEDLDIEQEPFPQEVTLNSPILSHFPAQLLGLIPVETTKQLKEIVKIKMFLNKRAISLKNIWIDSTRFWKGFQPHSLNMCQTRVLTPVLDNWQVIQSYYKSLGYSVPSETISITDVTGQYWNFQQLLNSLLLEVREKQRKSFKEVELDFLTLKIIVFQTGVLYMPTQSTPFQVLPQNKVLFTTIADLLGFHKVVSQRSNTLLFNDLQQSFEPDQVPTTSDLCQFYQIMDMIILKMGNAGIGLVKLLESIVLGWLGDKLGDIYHLEDQFKTSTRQEWIKFGEDWNVLSLLNQLEVIVRRQLFPSQMFQFYGLFRQFGYPRVSSRECLASIRSYSDKPTPFDVNTYLTDQADIRRDFYTRYLLAYNKPPQMDLSQVSPFTPLHSALKLGKLPNRQHKNYNHMDWTRLKFKASLPWPLNDTLSSFLSDKAITRGRKKWTDDPEGLRNRDTDTRLLVKYLDENLSSVAEVVNAHEEIYNNQDNLVIAIKVKELELKLAGRGFGLMTFELRILQVLREAIAKKTNKLFPEITMTETNTGLQKRKYILSRGSTREKNSVRIKKSLDIEKFCTSQRQLNSSAVFNSLDELLGTGRLFTRTHEIFEKTWLIDGSDFKPPDIAKFLENYQVALESGIQIPHVGADGIFSGLMGGIEGLCQYVWTICLLLRVSRVMNAHELTHQIAIQGDNAVITFNLPTEFSKGAIIPDNEIERVHRINKEIDTDLKLELGKVGLTLKIEETLTSEHLSIYGKDLHCPEHLCLPLKKAASACILSSEQFQDVPTFLSGLSTNLESVSEQVNSKVGVHIFGLILACQGWELLSTHKTWGGWNHPFVSKEETLWIRANKIKGLSQQRKSIKIEPVLNPQKEVLELILINSLVGSALGMLPFPTPVDLEKRGVGDFVSHRLAICKKSLDSGYLPLDLARKVLSCLNVPLSSELDYAKLFDSPYSLNIATEESAILVIKRLSKEMVNLTTVRNQAMRAHLETMNIGLKDMDNALSENPVINPRLCHLIREITPEKESEMFVHKFATARTMRARALKSSQNFSILTRLQKRSISKQAYTLWRLERQPRDNWKCSTTLAQELREKSWEKRVIGVTSPSPLEALKKISEDPINIEDIVSQLTFSISLMKSKPLLTVREALYTRGPLVPFFGTTTHPLVAKVYQEFKGNSKTNKVIQLLSLREGLVEHGSYLDQLILSLCHTALDIDLTSLPQIRQLEIASAGEALRGGQMKESMSPTGPDNFLSNHTHLLRGRMRLSEFHANIADFIIFLYCESRKEYVSREYSPHRMTVAIPVCDMCYRVKERVWCDITRPYLHHNRALIINPAQTYSLYELGAVRMSELPSLNLGEQMRLIGRSWQQDKTIMADETTKFYIMPLEVLPRLNPLEILKGYSEAFLYEVLKDQVRTHGSLYNVKGDPGLETIMLRAVIDKGPQTVRKLGYFFQYEEILKVLLTQGRIPYLPRAIPLTVTELTTACNLMLSQEIKCSMLLKSHVQYFPCLPFTDQDRLLDNLTCQTYSSLMDLKSTPLSVFLDVDLTEDLPLWEFPPDLFLNRSENFNITAFCSTIIPTRVEDNEQKSNLKPSSNEKLLKARGVKTKSLMQHQAVSRFIRILPDFILVLGGGLGGCAVPYLQKFNHCKLLFTTLRAEKERISESGEISIPPELLARDLGNMMVERTLVESEMCDMLVPGHRRLIVKASMKYIPVNGTILIINDIEPSESVVEVWRGVQALYKELTNAGYKLVTVNKVKRNKALSLSGQINLLSGGSDRLELIYSEFNNHDYSDFFVVVNLEEKMTRRFVHEIELDRFIMSAKKWVETLHKHRDISSLRKTLPKREVEIIFGNLQRVFLKLELLIPDLDTMKSNLEKIIQSVGPKMLKWEQKTEHLPLESMTPSKRKNITQRIIHKVTAMSWLLGGVMDGVWLDDLDDILNRSVQISRQGKIVPMSRKSKNPVLELRLVSQYEKEALKETITDLYQVKYFI